MPSSAETDGSYWRRRGARAWRDTIGDLSLHNRRRNVMVIIVAIVTVLILWMFGATDALKERVGEIATFVLAIAVVFPILLFWNWLCAPARIDNDRKSAIQALFDKLEPVELRMAVKNKLGAALATGEALLNEARTAPEGDANLYARVNEWYVATLDVITKFLGDGEAALFQSGSGITLFSGSNLPNVALRSAIGARTQRLAQILPRIDVAVLNPDSAMEQ